MYEDTFSAPPWHTSLPEDAEPTKTGTARIRTSSVARITERMGRISSVTVTPRSADTARADARALLEAAGLEVLELRTRTAVKVPTWRPGDVILVRFAAGTYAPAYTYVRGESIWPGERHDITDARVEELYRKGRVEVLLQSGGKPFDRSRMQ